MSVTNEGDCRRWAQMSVSSLYATGMRHEWMSRINVTDDSHGRLTRMSVRVKRRIGVTNKFHGWLSRMSVTNKCAYKCQKWFCLQTRWARTSVCSPLLTHCLTNECNEWVSRVIIPKECHEWGLRLSVTNKCTGRWWAQTSVCTVTRMSVTNQRHGWLSHA